MATFPNEKPCTPHDLIELAETGIFGVFEDALTDANAGLTRKDFDFFESGRSTGHSGIVIARPRSGQGDHWASEEDEQEWFQRPDYDPSTQGLDTSRCPNAQPAGPVPVQGSPAPFIPAPQAQVGMHVRMTGRQEAPPDVGNLGKGDGKEFERKLDAMFADLEAEK